jgi:hypothetical protein
MEDKRNIKALIEKESPNLNNILDTEDCLAFNNIINELKDTWTKKQIYRTETEIRFSVLNDFKHPTKASKYWQAVREQDVYLDNLMRLSFDYRRNEAKIKFIKNKLEKETDEYKKEILEIDLDEKIYQKASMELIAKDRIREIKIWSNIKKELDDGSFDNKDVNVHQLNSYEKIMEHKVKSLSAASTQPEIFNVIGQHETLKKLKKEKLIENNNTKQNTIEKK